MNKKLIRLTESDLHKIVKESVNKILKESEGINVNKWGGSPKMRAFRQPKGVDFGVLEIGDRISWLDRLEGNQFRRGIVTNVERNDKYETITAKIEGRTGLVQTGTVVGKPYDDLFKMK